VLRTPLRAIGRRFPGVLFTAERVLAAVPTLLLVVTVVFFAIRTLPGDPAYAILGDSASAEAIAALQARLGLDRPIFEQYLVFLRDLTQGDLGQSLVHGTSVMEMLVRVLPFTLELALTSILLGALIGIPLGIWSALERNGLVDYVTRIFSLIGFSMPVFFAAVLLILVFAIQWPLFPVMSAGYAETFGGRLRELVLPATAGALSLVAMITRATRSSLLEVLGEDYMRTARAKGAPFRVLIMRHALRNALIPVVTVIGLYFALVIGNSVLIETVFTRPGLGSLIVGSLQNRDYPMVQGLLIAYALIIVLVNLVTDISYGFVDPRVKR
jgi:ABC-type dipeptide/oligopeptide/nickel transport system permease component